MYSQKVLYSELINNNWDIFYTSADKGSTIRITADSLKDLQSDFSKIRNSIVFDSYRYNNSRNIFTYNVANGEIIQLTNLDTRDGHPVWSPDGSKIAFQSSRTGNPEVFVMNYEGENVEQLTFNEEFDGIPKWSPDGRLLAFNSNRDNSPNVYILNLETKEQTQVTSNESYNFIQDWVSQKEILIITDVGEKRQMQVVGTTGNLIKTIKTEGNVTYARCNRNGQIVFTQKTNSGVLNVFLTEYENNSINQLTNSVNEKRFPAFME